MPGVEAMIAEAIKTIGMSDQNNTVRTPIHTWYNNKFGNPDPGKYAWDWCNGAVTYWAWMSGNQDAVVFGGAYAYTVAHAQKFKDKGQWHVDVAGIQRGDIVFFDWNGSNNISAIDHVGIVEKVEGSRIHTIEGNYQNRCDRWVRDASTIVGYGRPKYQGGTTTPPPSGPAHVKLADAIAKRADATRVIQDALNKEFGGVVVDGDYGPQTTAAYTRWQQSLGWPGDGVPGAHSLWSLAKKYGFTTDITGTPAGPGGEEEPTTPPPTSAPYKVKAGDTLSKIAAAHNVPGGWEALYEANKQVIGSNPNVLEVGMELVIPTGSTTPTTPTTPTPEVPTVPTVIFEDTGPNGTVAANKVIQAALHKFVPPVTVDGIWGPKTKQAYHLWQRSLGFSGSVSRPGSDADGLPGFTSMSRLAAKYGFTLVRRSSVPSQPTQPTPTTPTQPTTPATPKVTDYLTVPEPAHDYARTTYGGKTVNKRTAAMLKLAAAWANTTITLTQGSYNKGVAASAGTHDGGGVVDINVNGWSSSKRAAVVLALRKAGFAAWLRTPAEGFSYHIHACAIGDKEMAGGAKNQVQAYFNRRNGLANNGADNSEHRWPNWADKYNQ